MKHYASFLGSFNFYLGRKEKMGGKIVIDESSIHHITHQHWSFFELLGLTFVGVMAAVIISLGIVKLSLVGPLKKGVKELRVQVEKGTYDERTLKDFRETYNSFHRQVSQEINDIKFKVNIAVLGDAERKTYINEIRALQEQISALQQNISVFARERNITLPQPQNVPPRGRWRGR